MQHQHKLRALLLTAAMALTIEKTDAQSESDRYELGAQAGVFAYQGDLSPSPLGSYKTLRPALGIFAARRMTDRIAARVGLNVGRLAGNEGRYKTPAFREQRNLRFSTPMTEFAGHLVWSPYGNSKRAGAWVPYAAVGGGLAWLRIRPDASGVTGPFAATEISSIAAQLAADAGHRKPRMIPSLQLGAGIRYQWRAAWAIQAESLYRYLPTDYLDGFSQAVNPKTRDQYMTHSVGVVYCSGRGGRMDCPQNVF